MRYLKRFESKLDQKRPLHKKRFIEKSLELHNNKYDYSKVEYQTARNPVIIICPIHGEFEQLPYNHLMGKGCDKCARDLNRIKLSKTKEQFIKDARDIHGDKYNYDKSVYVNDSSKIKIDCPLHGEFTQTVNHHLNGQGCPKCRWDSFRNTNMYKHSSSFPGRASITHNNFYDYSKVNYINARKLVEIICPKHGSFFQSPSNHLSGKGCPVCVQSQGEKKIESYLLVKDLDSKDKRNLMIVGINYLYLSIFGLNHLIY
jgi:hypothetical protein